MTLFPNVLKPGDEVLSFKESLAKKREETANALEQYRLYDHKALKDADRKKGRTLHHSELIRRVQKLNAAVRVAPVNYLPYNSDVLVANWVFRGPVNGEDTYISAFGHGELREFSFVLVDENDLPCEEVRGWRTVIIRLLKYGLLTWEQVKREFGDAEGLNAERWRRETQPYRAEKWAQTLNLQTESI